MVCNTNYVKRRREPGTTMALRSALSEWRCRSWASPDVGRGCQWCGTGPWSPATRRAGTLIEREGDCAGRRFEPLESAAVLRSLRRSSASITNGYHVVVIANSRGPEILKDLIDELGPSRPCPATAACSARERRPRADGVVAHGAMIGGGLSVRAFALGGRAVAVAEGVRTPQPSSRAASPSRTMPRCRSNRWSPSS
jgi:hypothetical protein